MSRVVAATQCVILTLLLPHTSIAQDAMPNEVEAGEVNENLSARVVPPGLSKFAFGWAGVESYFDQIGYIGNAHALIGTIQEDQLVPYREDAVLDDGAITRVDPTTQVPFALFQSRKLGNHNSGCKNDSDADVDGHLMVPIGVLSVSISPYQETKFGRFEKRSL